MALHVAVDLCDGAGPKAVNFNPAEEGVKDVRVRHLKDKLVRELELSSEVAETHKLVLPNGFAWPDDEPLGHLLLGPGDQLRLLQVHPDALLPDQVMPPLGTTGSFADPSAAYMPAGQLHEQTGPPFYVADPAVGSGRAWQPDVAALPRESTGEERQPPFPPSGCEDIRTGAHLAEAPHDAAAWREAFRAAGGGTDAPDLVAIRALRKQIWLQTSKALLQSRELNLWLAVPPPPTWPFKLPVGSIVPKEQLLRHPPSRACGWLRWRPCPAASIRVLCSLCQISVLQRDCLEAASECAAEGYKVAVLSAADAACPGGGYRNGDSAQEDLLRRSDAVRFTVKQRHSDPNPDMACMVSESVTVFRGREEDGYPFLGRPFRIMLLSISAVRNPPLTRHREYADPSDHALMETKVQLIVQAAAQANCDALVLPAFGCGAFRNPPKLVAQMFLRALQRTQLSRVFFCISEDHDAHHFHNPQGNFRPFLEVFAGPREACCRAPEVLTGRRRGPGSCEA